MPISWHFFHIRNCPYTHPPKDKFVLIVCEDTECRGFFVNSNISSFLQKHPIMLACQVTLKAADYYFLSKDSHLDCSRLRVFDDALLSDGRGSANPQTIAEVKQVITSAKTIERRYRKLICEG